MKQKLINIILIVILLIPLSFSIKQCSSIKHEYKNNIEALTDSIHYYKAKNGNLVATKLAYESDVKTLKLLNEDLYKQIKNLKIKNNQLTTTTHFSGVITNELHDTMYIVKHNTIVNGFYKDFNFNNQWRLLEGNVRYNNDSVGVSITKDVVMFDYTVVMDKDNKIYITSDNPYVKYNSISGFTIPKKRAKRFGIGPQIGVSYNIKDNSISPTIGIGLSYSLIKF